MRASWYVRSAVLIAVLVTACLATGCGGSIYLDDSRGDVGVCVGFAVGDEDGEEVSEQDE